MRFAFAGIDFLGDVFEAFTRAGWEPVKLFTRPVDNVHDFSDRVVAHAGRYKIPVQLSRIRDEDIERLAQDGCEALVVAGYPWRVLGWRGKLPHAFNFHPSPLPEGRGPYPLYRAILENRAVWGTSAHVLETGFDEGAVIGQILFDVAPRETHDSLLARCQIAARAIAKDLSEALPQRWAEARPQVGGSYWPRTEQEQRTLDWSGGVEDILRTVRAFGSIETIANLPHMQIFVANAEGWTEPHSHAPGTVVHHYRRHIVVAASDGFIQITRWSVISAEHAADVGR